MDVEKYISKGKTSHSQNKKLLDNLHRRKPKDLDEKMQTFHQEAFEKINCLACGNCCKTTSPIFYDKDIERLAKFLKIKPSEFAHQYLKVDEEKDFVLKSSPCPFIDSENYCLVYEHRPNACREYPHTDRKKFYQITDLTLKNTLVCPAVVEMVEKLKAVY